MEILIFLGGFLFGALCVTFYFKAVAKGTQKTNDMMFEQMKLYFENTANRLFKEGSSELVEQNKERLEEFYKRFKENSQELNAQNKEKLDDFYKHFKERIEDFERRAEENYKTEKENFTKFDTNIQHFLAAGNKISQDTNSLVNVMRSDNRKQGVWGEIVLERVLEASGLRKDEEYKIQSGTAEGRPDATVFLPDNKCVYIDSKTSFAAWEGYVNADDADEKEIHLHQFIESTKAHIAGLAKRDYSAEETSPDYVLMFIPIESCYALMFCEDCMLWDLAWKSKIMPVSPSTLLAALKIINSFHVVDRQNKNAKEIADLSTKMLDKFADLLSELLKVRNNLDTSLKKLNGKDNILRQIERMTAIGAKMNKTLPELPELDVEEN